MDESDSQSTIMSVCELSPQQSPSALITSESVTVEMKEESGEFELKYNDEEFICAGDAYDDHDDHGHDHDLKELKEIKIGNDSNDSIFSVSFDDANESKTHNNGNSMINNLMLASEMVNGLMYKTGNSKTVPIKPDLSRELIEERNKRIRLEYELQLEIANRNEIEKLYHDYVIHSMQRQFEDLQRIKTLKLELLKYKQKLQLKNMAKSKYSSVAEFKTNDGGFKCPICAVIMKSEVSMTLHVINHSVNDENSHLKTSAFKLNESSDALNSVIYECPFCISSSHNNIDIYLHIYKLHTSEKPLYCETCQLYCAHLDDLRDHQQSSHDGVMLPVKHVNIFDDTRKSNVNKAPNVSFNVNKSHPYLRILNALNRSKALSSASNSSGKGKGTINSDTPEVICIDGPLQNPIASTSSLSSLSASSSLTSKVKELKCTFPECDFTTPSIDKLEFHISAHTNSRYKCPYCPYVGNVINDIHRHIQKSKKHEGLKIFECNDCDFGTNCQSSFKEHMIVHVGKNERKITEIINSMFRNEYSKLNKRGSVQK